MNEDRYIGLSEFDKRIHKLLDEIHFLKVDVKILQKKFEDLHARATAPIVRGKPFEHTIDRCISKIS